MGVTKSSSFSKSTLNSAAHSPMNHDGIFFCKKNSYSKTDQALRNIHRFLLLSSHALISALSCLSCSLWKVNFNRPFPLSVSPSLLPRSPPLPKGAPHFNSVKAELVLPFPSLRQPRSALPPAILSGRRGINYDYWPVWFGGKNSIFVEEIIA